MSLFDTNTVLEFRDVPAVQNKFRNYILLNAEEFMSYLSEGLHTSVGMRESVPSKFRQTQRRKTINKERMDIIAKEAVKVNQNMCPTVASQYVSQSFVKSLSTLHTSYDIIVVIKPSARATRKYTVREGSRYINHEKTHLENKMAKIVGFLIAQKGECQKYPEAYAVNLICTRERGISGLLLGCYMYSIKSHPEYMQKGLLELSDEFRNVNGFCAYRKMGFRIDADIFTSKIRVGDCLEFSTYMLPMSVELGEVSRHQIIERCTQSVAIDEAICHRLFLARPESEIRNKDREFKIRIIGLYRLYYYVSMLFAEIHPYKFSEIMYECFTMMETRTKQSIPLLEQIFKKYDRKTPRSNERRRDYRAKLKVAFFNYFGKVREFENSTITTFSKKNAMSVFSENIRELIASTATPPPGFQRDTFPLNLIKEEIADTLDSYESMFDYDSPSPLTRSPSRTSSPLSSHTESSMYYYIGLGIGNSVDSMQNPDLKTNMRILHSAFKSLGVKKSRYNPGYKQTPEALQLEQEFKDFLGRKYGEFTDNETICLEKLVVVYILDPESQELVNTTVLAPDTKDWDLTKWMRLNRVFTSYNETTEEKELYKQITDIIRKGLNDKFKAVIDARKK